MRMFGFSTGALAKGDFQRGISLQQIEGVRAVELSALRESELELLLSGFCTLDLTHFDYVSFHAPSYLNVLSDEQVVSLILTHLPPDIPVVAHPDMLGDLEQWARLGERLCLENMDRRKRVGRTAQELVKYFDLLPEARLCFDIAHAHHVDPTMSIAAGMLWEFKDRIAQLHVSEVTEDGGHIRLGANVAEAYAGILSLIPGNAPVIIESVIGPSCIQCELDSVRRCFQPVSLLEGTSARSA